MKILISHLWADNIKINMINGVVDENNIPIGWTYRVLFETETDEQIGAPKNVMVPLIEASNVKNYILSQLGLTERAIENNEEGYVN